MATSKNWYNNILLEVLKAYEENKLDNWLSNNVLDIYITHELGSKLLTSARIILTIGGPYVYIDTEDDGIHRFEDSKHQVYYLPHNIIEKIEDIIQDRI